MLSLSLLMSTPSRVSRCHALTDRREKRDSSAAARAAGRNRVPGTWRSDRRAEQPSNAHLPERPLDPSSHAVRGSGLLLITIRPPAVPARCLAGVSGWETPRNDYLMPSATRRWRG